MITYDTGFYGFLFIFRFRGSALYKALPPVIVSSIVYFIVLYTTSLDPYSNRLFLFPEGLDLLMWVLIFLLQFRTNLGYGRYWEATTSIHEMHMRLIDISSEVAAFHLQSTMYNAPYNPKGKPPSYGSMENRYAATSAKQFSRHSKLSLASRLPSMHHKVAVLARKRTMTPTMEELVTEVTRLEQLENDMDIQSPFSKHSPSSKPHSATLKLSPTSNAHPPSLKHSPSSKNFPSSKNMSIWNKAIRAISKVSHQATTSSVDADSPVHHLDMDIESNHAADKEQQNHQVEQQKQHDNVFSFTTESIVTNQNHRRINGSKDQKRMIYKSDYKNNPVVISGQEQHPPSLFLQEGAHLLSLLSAVALSTLRNDVSGAGGTPLIAFTPGLPFPHVDPDSYTADVRKDWDLSEHKTVSVLRGMFGLDRTPQYRALYNAARPFRVIGGVSDDEIEVIQRSRGPSAKVSVVHGWLIEFISREYMNGSVGEINPSLLSRINQLVSDAMDSYNHARMITHNPFPFVHAQLTSFFVMLVVLLLPLLMISYVNSVWFGFVLNFLTVMCFVGLHEVSRELEWPFKNVPNDIPVNNFHGKFNESLLTMYAGYHPDSYNK